MELFIALVITAIVGLFTINNYDIEVTKKVDNCPKVECTKDSK